MASTQYYGTGRRKTSTARVFLRPGTGQIVVNRQPVEHHFPTEVLRLVIRNPRPVLVQPLGRDGTFLLAVFTTRDFSGQIRASISLSSKLSGHQRSWRIRASLRLLIPPRLNCLRMLQCSQAGANEKGAL